MVKIVVKTKSLLPSLREKKRYVVFEVISEDKQSFDRVKSLIKDQVKSLFGILGLANMGMIFLNDWNGNRGIVRINNKYINNLRGCFVNLNEQNLMVHTVGISGILKKARNNYFLGG